LYLQGRRVKSSLPRENNSMGFEDLKAVIMKNIVFYREDGGNILFQ
jgi:hypothetical protein